MQKHWSFFYSICLFLSSSAFAENLNELANHRQWGKLLHFEKNFWGTEVSQIDGSNFFLSKNGKKSKLEELKATLVAMREATSETVENEDPRCRFPARLKFLNKNGLNITERECPRFDKYFNALKGNSISLIFSSFYMNNPSSAFGHTFLRINKEESNQKRFELLDYGLNYAATVDTNNALIYGIKGMLGFFPGQFTSVPYYYKVREYNDAEARDLWEYELNYTPEQVEMLLAHSWELGSTYIDYWYFSENCSYHMLSLLEVGNPDLHLLDRLNDYVVPSDTVLVVNSEPGLVREIVFRPSIRRKFQYRYSLLTNKEKQKLQNLINTNDLSGDNEERAKIIDTAIDYYDFKFAHEVQSEGPIQDKRNEILKMRSEIPIVSGPINVPPSEDSEPHFAHPSRRWTFGRGYVGETKQLFTLVQYKFSIHDRLDQQVSYPRFSQITFGDFRFLKMDKNPEIYMDYFKFIDLVSLNPISDIDKTFSWKFRIAVEPTLFNEQAPKSWKMGVVDGSAGYTINLFNNNLIGFIGLRGRAESFKSNYYYLQGKVVPSVDIDWIMHKNLNLLFEGSWFKEPQYILGGQYSFNRKFGVRVNSRESINGQYFDLAMNYYF